MPFSGGGGGGGGGAVTFHGCKAYNSAVQSITLNQLTAVTFDSEEYDTDAFHSTSANTSRMTVPSNLAGKYLMTFSSFWASDPNPTHASFRLNGTTLIRAGGTVDFPGLAGQYANPTVAVVSLAAGDYVELMIQCGQTANLGHASVLDAQSAFSFTFLGA